MEMIVSMSSYQSEADLVNEDDARCVTSFSEPMSQRACRKEYNGNELIKRSMVVATQP